MRIIVDSCRKSEASLRKRHGEEARLVDVTSRAPEPWVRFSPFFPHGGIPVPSSPGRESQSVEGIWQGLKCFARQDVDASKFTITTMRGIKRSARSLGDVRGHRLGIGGELLGYVEARKRIYLPAYRFVLEHRLDEPLGRLRALLAEGPVVLLDYETNGELEDTRSPLSHAQLIAAFLEERWPA